MLVLFTLNKILTHSLILVFVVHMVVLDVARGHGHRRDRGSCSLLQFQLYTKSRDVAANSIVILIQISYHHHN